MIFILEDDDSIRKLIDYSLKSQGYNVQGFSHPSLFWKALEKEKPSLLLLDIMLPEEDGISILKKIRSNPDTSSIPIIMLTAKDTEFDVVTGLDAGADDYITKPFGMMNLVSRIKAVLRRYEKAADKSDVLTAGNLKIDSSKHTVFSGQNQIFLTVKEFDLLYLLLKNKGRVLSREMLMESIWEMSSDVESRTVDVHIRTLRQKLGEDGNLIETIRGVGYVIN